MSVEHRNDEEEFEFIQNKFIESFQAEDFEEPDFGDFFDEIER